MEQLADIYDFVSPCFPPKYDMFRVIFRKYHEHMAFMLDCVGACAESLANADILKVRRLMQTSDQPATSVSCEQSRLTCIDWTGFPLKVDCFW